MSKKDPEIVAMQQITQVVEASSSADEARSAVREVIDHMDRCTYGRVLRWAADRYRHLDLDR